jgi:light-regulated signal transduction histidine kinase (bacteriophytochrome)
VDIVFSDRRRHRAGGTWKDLRAPSSDEIPRTGLGLAITNALSSSISRIMVESDVGGAPTVTVRLPAEREEV